MSGLRLFSHLRILGYALGREGVPRLLLFLVSPSILRDRCMGALWAILFLFWVCVQSAEAAFEFHGIGCRAVGLGGSYVALAEGPEGIFWNPAGLTQSNDSRISIFWGRLFTMQALSIRALGGVASTPLGSIGMGIEAYGGSLYREVSVGVAYGWALGRSLSLGARLRYGRLSIKGFGSSGMLCMDAGVCVQMVDALRWGLSVHNLAGERTAAPGERVARTVLMGIGGSPVDRIMLALDVRKDLRFPTQVGAGAEVLLSEALRFWTGVRGAPLLFSAGFGLHVDLLSIQYTVTYHGVLGASHYASFGITGTGSRVH